MKKSIFIAATGQNVGKTTICLGILAGLKQRFKSVGFIKPVGQQHVKVSNKKNVDKDVVLFKEHFNLDSNWDDMSPVIIPKGFTKEFLDKKISIKELEEKINTSYKKISTKNDYTVVEGTGHVGVGSIVDLNNAKVAKQLNLDIVIVGTGGLGSTHDELALNINMCLDYGLKIRGVILNRVLESKRKMILNYFPKALEKWKIPLLGCVPYDDLLNNPTMSDFVTLLNSLLFSGDQHLYRHFQHVRLVAGSLNSYLQEKLPNELVITPASREDIIMATLELQKDWSQKGDIDFGGALILTGKKIPREKIRDTIRKIDIPALYTSEDSYEVMKKITSYIAKIKIKDTPKIKKAIDLVEKNIDFKKLIG